MTSILKHQLLGEIHGVQGDDVVQFLGVKYASLVNRFAKSELLGHNVGNSIIDATKVGYVLPFYYRETYLAKSLAQWSPLPSQVAPWNSASSSIHFPSPSSRFPNSMDCISISRYRSLRTRCQDQRRNCPSSCSSTAARSGSAPTRGRSTRKRGW